MAYRFPRRLLIHTINVQRTTGTSVDERGIESNTWANASSNVKCRITKVSESEDRQGRNTVVINYDCTMPGDTDIKASDRIYEPATGRYYEINSVREGTRRDGSTYYKSASLLFRE
tara:strand:- start:9 stop:356 length:348 start_codon:yes stop_codon:yes gene_type:complete